MHITSLFLYTYKLEQALHSVHPLPFCSMIESPTKFSKRGSTTRPQLLEEGY